MGDATVFVLVSASLTDTLEGDSQLEFTIANRSERRTDLVMGDLAKVVD